MAHRSASVHARRPVLGLALLALAASGSGCTIAPRIEAVDVEGDHGPDRSQVDWPRPVRVGVVQDAGRYPNLHWRVVRALEDGVDRVVRSYRPSREEEPVDYILEVDIDVKGDGRLSNLLAAFPGFVIFMPSWYAMRWDYEVTTYVRVRRGGTAAGPGGGERERVLRDAFVVKFTPPGVMVGSYLGFGALLFPPLIVAPLITGVVVALDDWEPRRFAETLASDPEAGWRWARSVASGARQLIDEDLRYE